MVVCDGRRLCCAAVVVILVFCVVLGIGGGDHESDLVVGIEDCVGGSKCTTRLATEPSL